MPRNIPSAVKMDLGLDKGEIFGQLPRMEPSISVVLVIGRKFEPKGENRALQTRLEPRRTPTPREGRRRLKACLGLASEATALVSSPKPVSQAVDPGGCWGKVAVLERGALPNSRAMQI